MKTKPSQLNRASSKMKIVVLMLAVAFCAGCISRQAKPTTWPQEREVHDALDIEGTFVDMDGTFRSIPWPSPTRDTSVRVISRPSTILLEFVLDSGAKENVEMRFKIESGWLIAKHGRVVNRDGVLAHEATTFYIRTDITGALIVRHAMRTIGMMFFVPVVGTGEYWSRLPKKEP